MANPRVRVDFGPPNMAAAVPPPQPAEQLEAAKDQLLEAAKATGVELTDEDFQVSPQEHAHLLAKPSCWSRQTPSGRAVTLSTMTISSARAQQCAQLLRSACVKFKRQISPNMLVLPAGCFSAAVRTVAPMRHALPGRPIKLGSCCVLHRA